MSICRVISRLKSSIFSKKVVGLSTVLTEEVLRQNLYLRPGTPQQRLHMMEAYLKATKALYPNGGHIFVGSLLAAKVLHYLDANLISYTVHSLVDLNAHLDIMPVTDKAEGGVRVFVEDDTAPYAEREKRLLKVQSLFAPGCVPIHTLVPEEFADTKAYMQMVNEIRAEVKRLRRFVIFYEMNTTIGRQFQISMCQLRGRFSYCIISTEDSYEKKARLLNEGTTSDRDDSIFLMANTTKIYGSGPKHKKEMFSLSYDGEDAESSEVKNAKPINIGKFFKEAIGDYGLILQDGRVTEVILNQ